jgi:putative molybdopterin biosynthesis protein
MESLSLETNSLEEALERWMLELDFRRQLRVNAAETVPVEDSLSRVTAGPVFAEVSSPDYFAASLDGIAVLSSRTFGVTGHSPLRLRLGDDAFFVDTGSIMPDGTDAVVPIEKVHFPTIDQVEIDNFCAPWENVRALGEDLAARELIIPAFHEIRPLDVAAMIQGGVNGVAVVKKPVVGILPVGSGLLPPGSKPQAGKVFETSSRIVANMVRAGGGEPVVMDITPETMEDMVRRSQESITGIDLLVVIAGPSLGTWPIAQLINKMGGLVAYGMRVKPGMSTCLGVVDGLPIIGVPKYALSTYIIFQLFGIPLLCRKLGIQKPRPDKVPACLSQTVTSPDGLEEFIRVSLGEVDGRPVAVPVSRGAHVLMSLVRADGIMRIGPGAREAKAGDRVEVELLRPGTPFGGKVLVAGTHDISFDLLNNEMQRVFPGFSVLTSNVGGLRGLAALKAGYCHGASMHLFDEDTGEFNVPFIRKLMPDLPLILVSVICRRLGLVVARGNPRKILSLQDLQRDGVKVINRIRGSGTRMMFDYHLRAQGIDVNRLKGYSDEAHTHLNLASAVASGHADAGLGILEAAKATGQDFIPLFTERLDLAIPKNLAAGPGVKCLLQVLNSLELQKELSALGGYDVCQTGRVVYEQ